MFLKYSSYLSLRTETALLHVRPQEKNSGFLLRKCALNIKYICGFLCVSWEIKRLGNMMIGQDTLCTIQDSGISIVNLRISIVNLRISHIS